MADTKAAENILKATIAPQSVKADAWDAFSQATSGEDLANRLEPLKMNTRVKADLWDAWTPQTTVNQPATDIPGQKIGAEPGLPVFWTPGGGTMRVDKATVRGGLEYLPLLGGAVGGVAGATLGGAGAIPGAYLGGAAGAATQQLLQRALGVGPAPTTSGGAAESIMSGGEQQALLETGGQIAAPLLRTLAKPLKEGAIKSMTQVLGPTKLAMKAQAEKVAPGLVERGVIARSRASLSNEVAGAIDRSSQALDVAMDATPSSLTPDKRAAIQELEQYKNRFLVRRDVTATPEFVAFDEANRSLVAAQQSGAYPTEIAELVVRRDATEKAIANLPLLPGGKEAGRAVDVVSGIQKKIAETDPSFFGLRQLRQVLDKVVDKDGNYVLTKSEFIDKELNRRGADSIRRILASANPDVAAVNKEFSFWLGVRDVLSETQRRTAAQTGGIVRTLAGVAGAGAEIAAGHGAGRAGLTGTAFYALKSLFDSTAWRSAAAVSKDRLANAIMSGNSERVIANVGRIMAGKISLQE